MTRSILLAFTVFALGGCATSGESSRVHELLGDKTVRVLKAADRVEVFRIKSQRDPAAQNTIGGFPIISAGREQGADFRHQLAHVLLADSSYEWNMAKGCTFDPGVAYRVWSGSDSIVVLDCFNCDEVGFIADEKAPGTMVIHDADPGRPQLLKLAKEALPQDAAIQSLTSHG